MNEITISIKDFSDRMRNLLREEAQLAADRKELELQGKASGINVSQIKKWLKAEVQDEEAARPTKIAKLITQTQDQVLYGESLGHDLGMLQNNASTKNVSVRNNSNAASASLPEAAKGDGATLLPASSPDKFQAKASEGETDTTARKCGVGGLASRESGGSDSVASIYAGSASSLHAATTVAPGTHSILAGLTAGEGSSGEDGLPEPRTSPLQIIQGRAAE